MKLPKWGAADLLPMQPKTFWIDLDLCRLGRLLLLQVAGTSSVKEFKVLRDFDLRGLGRLFEGVAGASSAFEGFAKELYTDLALRRLRRLPVLGVAGVSGTGCNSSLLEVVHVVSV